MLTVQCTSCLQMCWSVNTSFHLLSCHTNSHMQCKLCGANILNFHVVYTLTLWRRVIFTLFSYEWIWTNLTCSLFGYGLCLGTSIFFFCLTHHGIFLADCNFFLGGGGQVDGITTVRLREVKFRMRLVICYPHLWQKWQIRTKSEKTSKTCSNWKGQLKNSIASAWCAKGIVSRDFWPMVF